jgi:hypothetical protein
MAHINFWIQSVLIACGVTFGVLCLFDASLQPYFFFVQVFIGCWQFFGALASGRMAGKPGIRKIQYMRLAIIYLLLLIVSPYLAELVTGNWLHPAYMLFLILPSWCLAFFYYSLTIMIAFPRRSTGDSFLPHTSF